MRKVAMAAGAGFIKPEDFKAFWPLPEELTKEVVRKVWGSKEEMEDMKRKIQEAHGIRLK